MANIQIRPKFKVMETREITYEERSAFFGLVKWHVQECATHIANDIVIILRTPIRKIFIDNNGEEQEVNLPIKNTNR